MPDLDPPSDYQQRMLTLDERTLRNLVRPQNCSWLFQPIQNDMPVCKCSLGKTFWDLKFI